MEYINSILLGVIQGLTEFWPISSSGHLVVAHDILNFDFVNNLSFDVALHLGTLVALLVYFWRDIIRYIVAFIKSIANFNVATDSDQRLAWMIVVGTIPAALVGYFFASLIEDTFRAVWIVATALIVGGVLFIIFERLSFRLKELSQMKWVGAIAIGCAQALALIPGVSRSGATILTGMANGLSRKEAARFSFLLSIPIVFGAGVQNIVGVAGEGLTGMDWQLMAIGFVTSALIGYIAIRVLLRWLTGHSLDSFGYYRIALGLILILYTFVQ